MTDKERFIEIYNTYIKREGAKELLEYLTGPQSDFFTAPASTRYHNSCRGGLVNHSELHDFTVAMGGKHVSLMSKAEKVRYLNARR